MLSSTKDYGFLIGLIRVLETRMLNASHIERMLDAQTADEAFAVLNDTDFKDSVPEAESVKDFDLVLEHSLLETKNMLEHHAPSKNMCAGLWAWYDFYNTKVALKSFVRGDEFTEDQKMLSPFGVMDFKIIRDFAFFGQGLENFLPARSEILKRYEESKDIRVVDFVFDNIIFQEILTWTKKLGSDVLQSWVKRNIDLTNIQTFLRVDANTSLFQELFIEGGNLEKIFFQAPQEEFIEKVLRKFNIASGLEKILQDHEYQVFLKQSDNLLTEIIKAGRYEAHGPEAIIGYWWARQKSAEIIRIILAGKTNHIDNEIIRASIKALY